MVTCTYMEVKYLFENYKVYQIQHHRVIQKELPPIIVSQN